MKIRFPIGDWSGDGHGQCEYFIAETNDGVTLAQVREAHFKSKEVLGFDIGDICRLFEESSLTKEQATKLKELNFYDEDIMDSGSLWTQDIFEIWIFLLNHIDPSLGLVEAGDSVPEIHFYGKDEKGRHLNTPGYGVFQL